MLIKTSYPYLIRVYDAKIPESLTPSLVRKLTQGVRQLEKGTESKVLDLLPMTSSPRDPELIANQVLKPVAITVLQEQKGTQPEKMQVESLVRQWRESCKL